MTFRIKVGDGFERLEPGMGRKPEKHHRPTKIAFGLAALVAMGSLFGCAAVFAERETGIAVNTNPAGAEVLVDGQPRGTTPGIIPVSSQDHSITVRKAGYSEGVCTLTSSVGAGWVVLDIVLTGLIGVIVDAATDDWSAVDQHQCDFQLAPMNASQAPPLNGVSPYVPDGSPVPPRVLNAPPPTPLPNEGEACRFDPDVPQGRCAAGLRCKDAHCSR